MIKGTIRALRYARSWKTGADIVTEETSFERDGVVVPATIFLPARHGGRLPAWIALGGISRMGRLHPQLVRFAGALASSGTAVLVPEIPEWRELRVSPEPAEPTIRGCLDTLVSRADVRPGKVGLIGFSFGAPQVAIAASEQDLAPRVAGIVLFGGYCSLEQTLRYQFTGRHAWDGDDHELVPDPYGRWVVGANHLTDVPGYEDAGAVASALHRLACAASDQRVSAWECHHDALIDSLRHELPAAERPIFDLFATPTTRERPGYEPCAAMAEAITEACRRVEPRLDPGSYLANVDIPTRLVHGRGDRLIPYTECLRLHEGLPPSARNGRTITGLFSHTADRDEGSWLGRVWETVAFFQVLRGLMNTVPTHTGGAGSGGSGERRPDVQPGSDPVTS
jgi:pimeloyl-ACP methyl ester carboxylesterase